MKCEDCKHCDLCYEWDGEDEVQYQFCRKHGKELEMDADGCEDFKVHKPRRYVEKSTKCDMCEYLSSCNVMDVTTSEDTMRHYIPGIGTICRK